MPERPDLRQIEAIGDNRDHLERLIEQIRAGSGITPFVGAGMSVPFGYPGWGDFLIAISRRPAFDVEQWVRHHIAAGLFEEAAEALAGAGGAVALQDALRATFSGGERFNSGKLKGAVTILPRLANGPVVTTNFDHVLEHVFQQAGRDFKHVVWGGRANLALQAFHQNWLLLLKVHGDVDDDADRVLTHTEYERCYGVPESPGQDTELTKLIQVVMTNRPLLFVGCSLERDRIVRFLARFVSLFSLLRHYAIVEQPSGEAAFHERSKHLSDHGVRPIWYPPGRQEAIEVILEEVARRVAEPADAVVPGAALPGPTPSQKALAAERIQALISTPPAEVPPEHYEKTARHLAAGKLVPFLGFGVNLGPACPAGGGPWAPGSPCLPDATALAAYLGAKYVDGGPVETGADLSRVAQYIHEMQGPAVLRDEIHDLYQAEYEPRATHWFLALLPSVLRQEQRSGEPLLILTTNWDDVLERAFVRLGEPLDVLSYVAGGKDRGRFLYRPSGCAPRIVRTRGHAAELGSSPRTLLVKLHGSIDRDNPAMQSIVLTEDDHIDYVALASKSDILPAPIVEKLDRSHILFLEYGMRDWNIRVLLRRLRQRQGTPELCWAVLWRVLPMTRTLWTKRGVEVIDARLDNYLSGLLRAI